MYFYHWCRNTQSGSVDSVDKSANRSGSGQNLQDSLSGCNVYTFLFSENNSVWYSEVMLPLKNRRNKY
jgi:hypothetical protein